MVSSKEIENIEILDGALMDQNINKPCKVSKNAIVKIYVRFWFLMSNAFNYATLQGIGYGYCMYPALRQIFKNDKSRLETEIINNSGFFNTNASWAPLIAALHIKMLEAGAASEDAIKVKLTLMGPLAGIGDTLSTFTITPVLTIIAAQFSQEGNIAGPFILLIGQTTYSLVVSITVLVVGLKLGDKIVENLSQTMSVLSNVASIIGITVIVGLSLTFVKFNLDISWTQNVGTGSKTSSLKLLFDNLAPNLLPLSALAIFSTLVSKAKWSIIKVILFTMVVSLVGVTVGFISPM